MYLLFYMLMKDMCLFEQCKHGLCICSILTVFESFMVNFHYLTCLVLRWCSGKREQLQCVVYLVDLLSKCCSSFLSTCTQIWNACNIPAVYALDNMQIVKECCVLEFDVKQTLLSCAWQIYMECYTWKVYMLVWFVLSQEIL